MKKIYWHLYDKTNDSVNMFFFRDWQNDLVDIEDSRLLSEPFHKKKQILVENNIFFNSANHNLCCSDRNANATRSGVKYARPSSDKIFPICREILNSTLFFIFQPVNLSEYRSNVVILSHFCDESSCCLDYGINTQRCYFR